ncbi:MAG: tetraacyldisaccharide 4'-kinase, partial [Syntrophobacteraceae bacterium]
LREPPSNLKRADVLVITHAGKDGDAGPLRDKLRELFPGIPVFACRHTMRGISLTKGGPLFPLDWLLDRKAVVFAGIARPESFFMGLGEAGITICDSLSFPDHHRYTVGDFLKIIDSASKHGAEVIITTAKDAVRIPPPCRHAVAVAEMGIDFGPDHEEFCGLTKRRLGRALDKQSLSTG